MSFTLPPFRRPRSGEVELLVFLLPMESQTL
jgi:hypothetical protein